ncbi:hypothetical protein BOO69_09630 [Sulfitobacter alexandrii]|uniref:DUF7694 domain-containing protein n=1 Tax=Sulfitobacter alexandrii TaxID=1917485 RepID=A0A1J0WH36_9RHOB|nr:hypothetical protein [Sulfitobacter alexandrii]APE43645.1 hypothetical protein BOO69_09630 [Sulfitobacter alexandrii]
MIGPVHEHGDRAFRRFEAYGFEVTVDVALGRLGVAHDGTITWDQLQEIKNLAWGTDACAIEVYPAGGNVVNSRNMRHLWRLGETDFCPDLLGADQAHDSLQSRYERAWAEARR